MLKSKRFRVIYIGTLSLIALAYMLLIMRGSGDWGGTTPPDKPVSTAAVDGDIPDNCPALIRTPRATWLLTYQQDDHAEPKWKVDASTVALDSLVPAPKEKAKADDDSQFAPYLPKSTHWSTLMSKLDAKGVFQPVATVQDSACLHTTPDGATVYVLSNLDNPQTPGKDGTSTRAKQSAVFRSDDQGAHWTWLKDGFFPDAASMADNLQPSFYNNHEVWVWAHLDSFSVPSSAASSGGDALQDVVRLFYSPDGGMSVQQVKASAPFAIGRTEAMTHFPADSNGENDGSLDDVKGFIVQLSDDHAIAWLSQSFYYGVTGDHYARRYAVLAQMDVRREGQTWVMGAPKRTEGANLESVTRTPDGQIYALMVRSRADDVVARFDTKSLTWTPLAAAPNPFSPLPASVDVRNLWASDRHIVISTRSTYTVPRFLYPFGYDNASIHGLADYYSDDQGQHWTHLNAHGNLLAFDPRSDELMSSPHENWFSTAPVRAYQLGR